MWFSEYFKLKVLGCNSAVLLNDVVNVSLIIECSFVNRARGAKGPASMKQSIV